MVHLAMGNVVSTLDALLSAKLIPLSAMFLQACHEAKVLPETSHVMVLTEEISLAYARHLFDCGNAKGAFHYCDKADEKGEMLQRELAMLLAKPEEEHSQ